MADDSEIEWTDATWNPITGCSVKSPGCTNCYAMRLAGTRLAHHPSRAGLTQDTKAGPVWTGEVRLNEQWLDQPLRWKRPRRIFVCAHGDLFHESVPDEWIDRVFGVMAAGHWHTFQVLTKRAERMRKYFATLGAMSAEAMIGRLYIAIPWAYRPERPGGFVNPRLAPVHEWLMGRRHLVGQRLPDASATPWQHPRWPLPNVWLGVSAEDQPRADERIPHLLATPAAVRWVSAEPLLGPVDLTRINLGEGGWVDALRGRLETGGPEHADRDHIDWIVAGGESGPGARPMHPAWARDLRDQCAAAGVPLLFKQWGEWLPFGQTDINGVWNTRDPISDRGVPHRRMDHPDGRAGAHSWLVGKKAAGRLLDGVEHNGYPTPPAQAVADLRSAGHA